MNTSFMGKAILTKLAPVVIDGKFIQEATSLEVEVMAIVKGYAMVRRKGAMPFICNVKDLKELKI